MDELGRILIIFGAILVVIGLVVVLAGRIPLLGHLPGDLHFQTDGVSCFVPIATSLLLSLLLSILLTLIVNLLQRRGNYPVR